RPWFHQALHFRDEGTIDPRRGQAYGRASAPYHGPDRRADQRHAEHQARKEAHRGAAKEVGCAREPLSVDGEGSVEVPHDHRQVIEEEVVLDPPQADDFVADLIGPPHVVVPHCPQVLAPHHCRSSASVGTEIGASWPTMSLEATRFTAAASSRYRSSAPACVASSPNASTWAAIDLSSAASEASASVAGPTPPGRRRSASRARIAATSSSTRTAAARAASGRRAGDSAPRGAAS